MKNRIRQVARVLFEAAAALSLCLCIAAIVLALFGDHFRRKYVAVGPVEAMSHHDVIIVTWGAMRYDTLLDTQWSAEFPGGGFQADIDRREQPTWIFTLNMTHITAIVLTALLPGAWVAWYLRRRSQGEIDYCPACGKTIGTGDFSVCPACGIRFVATA